MPASRAHKQEKRKGTEMPGSLQKKPGKPHGSAAKGKKKKIPTKKY